MEETAGIMSNEIYGDRSPIFFKFSMLKLIILKLMC